MSIRVTDSTGSTLGHVEMSSRTGGKVTLAGFSEVLGHTTRNAHGDGWTTQDTVGHTAWLDTRRDALQWLWNRRELILANQGR